MSNKIEQLDSVTNFCCPDMKQALKDRFIGNFMADDTSINIYNYCLYGVQWEMEIKFCPFCGKEIENENN